MKPSLATAGAQGCHASTAALWEGRESATTQQYCAPQSLGSMTKVSNPAGVPFAANRALQCHIHLEAPCSPRDLSDVQFCGPENQFGPCSFRLALVQCAILDHSGQHERIRVLLLFEAVERTSTRKRTGLSVPAFCPSVCSNCILNLNIHTTRRVYILWLPCAYANASCVPSTPSDSFGPAILS